MLRLSTTPKFDNDVVVWLEEHFLNARGVLFRDLVPSDKLIFLALFADKAVKAVTVGNTELKIDSSFILLTTQYENLPLKAEHFCIRVNNPFDNNFEVVQGKGIC